MKPARDGKLAGFECHHGIRDHRGRFVGVEFACKGMKPHRFRQIRGARKDVVERIVVDDAGLAGS